MKRIVLGGLALALDAVDADWEKLVT